MSDRTYIGAGTLWGTTPTGQDSKYFSLYYDEGNKYADEQEVRAFLWVPESHAGINSHIDGENRIYPLPLYASAAKRLKGRETKSGFAGPRNEHSSVTLGVADKLDEIAH